MVSKLPLVFALTLLTILSLLTIASAASDFSSIEISYAYPDGTSATSSRSYFRGTLFCEDGCSTLDKFSLLGGVTTGLALYEISTLEIVFYSLTTGESLVTIPQDAKFLSFPATQNRFDDATIQWSNPIPVGTTVGFRGSIRFNWISKEKHIFLDSAILTYTPHHQPIMPQVIAFQQRFAFAGSEYGLLDGVWDQSNSKEGSFMVILDGIRADAVGIQVKLIGMSWLNNKAPQCTINGLTPLKIEPNFEQNTMTFLSPQSVLPSKSDIIVICASPMLKPLSFSAFPEVTAAVQSTIGEIRLIEKLEDFTNPNKFYKYVQLKTLFNVIEKNVPNIVPRATLYGDAIVCEFNYSILGHEEVPIRSDSTDTFSFQLTGYPKSAGNAIVHVISNDDINPIVLQSIDRLQQTKNVYNKTPLLFETDEPQYKIKFRVYIPLDNSNTVENRGIACRMNLVHPTASDKDMTYAYNTPAIVQREAFSELSLPNWNKPYNSTASIFSIEMKGPKQAFNYVKIDTTTYDFLFSGEIKTCEVSFPHNVDNTPTIVDVVDVQMVDFGQSDLNDPNDPNDLNDSYKYRVSSFIVKVPSGTVSTDEQSVILTCNNLYYAVLPTVSSNSPAFTTQNTILVTIWESDNEHITDEPQRLSSTLVTSGFSPSKRKKQVVLLVVAVLALIAACVGGFFSFKRFQRKRRINQEQFQLLLNEEATTLVIQ
jgi:hypothetical protein